MAGAPAGSEARLSALVSVRRRQIVALGLGGSALATAVLLAPLVGSTSISLGRVFDSTVPFADNLDAQIFFIARLPRVLSASLVGAALAASGVVFQALLRNPLADPFTLGISSGAALGVILTLTFGLSLGLAGVPAVSMASFAGSAGAVAIVYSLATVRRRGLSSNVLLLAGVTLNAFFSALILFVQYLSDFAETFRTVRWLMGNLDVASYTPIVVAAPLVGLAFFAFAWLPRALNLLTFGAESAATRGIDVLRIERLAFFSASLATGASVALGGPVGFVGIIVPHFVRLLAGTDHRVVLPASALVGGAFLIICDLGARTLLAPQELPVGIITAVLGGPFFLWLLVTKR
ncbi:MAG: iron ABC transporter permease [Acidobacteria bacterium]|nr:iron ABC transporter permease [Acidobacteriota bacterium]